MAKRRLNRHQKQRIQIIQEKRRERAHERVRRLTEELDDVSLGPESIGTVIACHGASMVVETGDGELVRCVPRQNLGSIVCGDRVVWQMSSDLGVVSASLPRNSLLSRPGVNGALKPVAANLDLIAVVAATEPKPDPHLVDRYLVAAECSGIPAQIVLNKCDLLRGGTQAEMEQRFAEFRKLGYPVIFSSTQDNEGMAALLASLAGHTSILVGQSGVGKSSLISRILPDKNIRIGSLSAQAGLGRHTTSTTTLYHLPAGGRIIDSPGVRQFGLWNLSANEVLNGFVEFRELRQHCQFRDCSHQVEPGCALHAAVEDGTASRRRLESYHRIVSSLQEG